MTRPGTEQDTFGDAKRSVERLLRDGAACLGLSERDTARSVVEHAIDLRGVIVSLISLDDPDEMSDHDLVLAAALPGVEARSPHALEFLFEINLANTLAGAGAFGRDNQGKLLLLKAMRSKQLDGMALAAHVQWMVALVESVRDELRRLG